jgi:uncharacterized CHY-type Zn-finger protein
MSFKKFFHSDLNEDGESNVNSTSDIAVHPMPLFTNMEQRVKTIICNFCNAKNTIDINDKGIIFKCAFCGKENNSI